MKTITFKNPLKLLKDFLFRRNNKTNVTLFLGSPDAGMLYALGTPGAGMLYTPELESLRSMIDANESNKVVERLKEIAIDNPDEYNKCIYWLMRSHPNFFSDGDELSLWIKNN